MVVRIGIDFGTAFTKVAIRAGVDLVIVDWSAVTGDETPLGRYVLPGFICREQSGGYCWGPAAPSSIQGNLKLPVIDIVGTEQCPAATVAFLALVIRYARAYLYRHPEVGRKLSARSLRWELNVGCPTEPHEKPEVVARFRRIAHVAWQLSRTGDLREDAITSAWRTAERDVGLEVEPGVVPEFVAQIAGYLASHPSEGLYAMVDIGAATLDVATFNIVLPNDSDSTPQIPIFFSAVRPLGTHYLQHNRHSHLGLDLEWDDAAAVEPADLFATRYGKHRSDVDSVDSDFVGRAASCISGVINGTRTHPTGAPVQRDRLGEYPKGSVWRDGLPVFVTGGGASCDLYRRALETGRLDLKRQIGSSRDFRFVELNPLGEKFPGFSPEVGSRLSVAIGLTEDAASIARVVPHRQIKPITRTLKKRLDHTEIYSDR